MFKSKNRRKSFGPKLKQKIPRHDTKDIIHKNVSKYKKTGLHQKLKTFAL